VEADNYIVDAASRAGEVMLVTYVPTTEQAFYSTIVRVKNLIHGKLKYYQPLNEMFAPAAKVYERYTEAYRAIYRWNTNNPNDVIKVGGPAWATFRKDDTTAFFTLFKNDPDNTRKSLDFFSVHYYACWDNIPTPGFYDNYRATTQRRDLNDILETVNYERLPKTLPMFISESSLFGGNESKYHDGTLAEDLIKESSYMVVRNYFLIKYNYNPSDRFFNWVTQKNGGDSSVRKGMIAYTSPETGGTVAEGVGTPYLFVMKMMKMLKTTRIYDVDPPTPTGYEINCFATKDDTGIAVILVNYQRNNSNTYNVTLDIDNLANTALKGKRFTVDKYLVDASHNNFLNGATGTNLGIDKLGATETLTARGSYSTTETIGKNAVMLIVLTPVAGTK
jgi:hypothetical protein